MFRNITNVDFSGRFHPRNNLHNCENICHQIQFATNSNFFTAISLLSSELFIVTFHIRIYPSSI